MSTAYEYTREQSNLIKRVSPSTVQILGGNLAASAEVVLRKTHIDFCVLGDGENIMKNLISLLQKNNFELKNKSIYKEIKGLTFLNGDESRRFVSDIDGQLVQFPGFRLAAWEDLIPTPNKGKTTVVTYMEDGAALHVQYSYLTYSNRYFIRGQ